MTRPAATDALLEVRGVAKRFPPAAARRGRLRAFWRCLVSGRVGTGAPVLEGIDFEIRRGESMAVIGANGAGKSTLLKLITGVLAPSAGRIDVHGRISALLELGAGFEPEYSGLDNLRMNAALMGLTRQQIEARTDDILAFADIGEAIHEPIKHYSSGMVVRLGFAIVASVRPDLLITDEVLAVGDESFQKKCIRWVEGYLADGGTLLMVSHNMYHVQKLCRHALWLENGRARAFGDVFDVTQSYLAWHERKDAESGSAGRANAGGAYRLERVTLAPGIDAGPAVVDAGGRLEVHLEMRSPDGRAPVALIGVVRADGTPVYGVASDHDDAVPAPAGDGRFRLTLSFPELPLLPGGYAVRAHAMDPEGLRIHDTLEVEFTVRGRSRALGLVALPHEWSSGDEAP